jgi:hypothetical protein
VVAFEGLPAAEVVDTPDTPTIQTLVDLFNARADLRRDDRAWVAGDTLKNLVVKLKFPDGTVTPLAIGVPGDREVDMKRLEAQVSPAEIEPFSEDDFAKNPRPRQGLHRARFAGRGPTRRASATWSTRASSTAPAGSPVPTPPGKHVKDLVMGRDFTPDGIIEAAEVHSGDPCPMCGSPLEMARGIEMGHIFQLGRKYAEALGLTVLDENGKTRVVTMGSYGIGVSRAVAAVAELNCDDKGLVLAPRGCPRRRAHRRHGQGHRPATPCGRTARRAVRSSWVAGALRRSRRRVARREVQRRGAAGDADDRGRRPRPGRWRGGSQGSTHRREKRRRARRRGGPPSRLSSAG